VVASAGTDRRRCSPVANIRGATAAPPSPETPVRYRLEICPVYTTPSDDDLPPRPTWPAGIRGHNVTIGAVFLNEGSSPNELLNPAVIPVLASGESPADRAARFSVTYYYPDTLRLRDNDPRLVWSSSVSQGSPQVRFVAPSGGTAALGLTALIHGTGTQEGEVKLDLRFEGSLLASCRALVRRMRRIPVRVNILNATRGRSPRTSPRQVLNHLAVANVIFRQIGLELVRDTNATRTDGATATQDRGRTIDGVFRIRVSPGLTRNVDWSANSGYIQSSAMNHRPNVVNINYIRSAREITHRGARHRPIGICTDHPANRAGNSITDSGTPSTSWVSPSGVLPDAAAGTVRMNLAPARQRPTPANVVAIWIRDFIDPDDADAWGRVISHEVGHALGLRHRGNAGTGRDGVGHPDEENRMYAFEDTFGLDFDLIQAMAVIQSPIVQGP